MNGDFMGNSEDVLRNIETAEVLSILLPLLGRSLLVDTRCDAREGPMIRVVPMAGSVEERLRSLQRMRPHLPHPERLTVIPWPKRVLSLQTLGIWERIVERLVASGYPGMEKASREVFSQLVHLEREEIGKAITGQGYHTIWSAGGRV